SGTGKPRRALSAAEKRAEYAGMSDEGLMKKVKQLEERMYRHARDLEFEEAAHIRDEIAALKTDLLDMPVVAAR
ncbi:MAG: UvrB/UvrC motif-containing protein, partial [Proteobacteria bacterium]|nr:UvrB/UvrC motif-containing protein [Pseudomonadota bacterium]